MLDRIEMKLRHNVTGELFPVHIDVHDNSLSRKWLPALNELLNNNYHLEKNYCFFGFPDGERDLQLLVDQINATIKGINDSSIDYYIDDHFTVDNVVEPEQLPDTEQTRTDQGESLGINHEKFNQLHLYFEETQGESGNMSRHYNAANAETRWYIRQLNLLCHEAESLILSLRKKQHAPEWIRPSNIMCWLNAPRFALSEEDYELFGVNTIAKDQGGVYVGVNKAVGKHHWEVFQDEGRDSRIGELVTTSLKPQTIAAGDFDIEWGNPTLHQKFMRDQLNSFRGWLTDNNFDPNDKSLTIGHPKVAQVDLKASFSTTNFEQILSKLTQHLDVYSIRTSNAYAEYDYTWRDSKELQVSLL
jgi:hypothetical protein